MDPIIPQSQEQLYSPIPERKNFMNKKFALTLIAIFIFGLIVSGGIWLWFNNNLGCNLCNDSIVEFSDETVDWQTYKNDKYGFEFKYPGNTQLASSNELGDLIRFDPLVTSNISVTQLGSKDIIFSVEFRGNEMLTPIWVAKQSDALKPAILNPSPVVVVVAGMTGYEIKKGTIAITTDFPQGTAYASNNYFLQKTGGHIFQLVVPGNLGNQILSTFKFIDSAISSECLGKETTEIGGSAYPVSAKYSTLGGLGSYFTAEDCSTTRLSEVVKNQYPYPEHIILNQLPSTALVTVLKRIGLSPSPEKCANKSDSLCVDWRPLKESDLIPANIIQLRPFMDFIKSASCYFCG